MTVRLFAEETALLSRISCKSAYDLNLKEGDKVFAQVKTAALLT
jgi:ABC-type molybdate transport system ATPase subunit